MLSVGAARTPHLPGRDACNISKEILRRVPNGGLDVKVSGQLAAELDKDGTKAA
jgi:hypothetical protein